VQVLALNALMDTIWIMRRAWSVCNSAGNAVQQMFASNVSQDMSSTMVIVWHALLEHFITDKLCK